MADKQLRRAAELVTPGGLLKAVALVLMLSRSSLFLLAEGGG